MRDVRLAGNLFIRYCLVLERNNFQRAAGYVHLLRYEALQIPLTLSLASDIFSLGGNVSPPAFVANDPRKRLKNYHRWKNENV